MTAHTTSGVLAEVARRAANHPTIEAAVVGAVRATLPLVIQLVLRELYPGETLRLYIPKIGADTRADRVTSVLEALDGGSSAQEVSKALGVPVRTVRHIRARRGTIGGKPTP